MDVLEPRPERAGLRAKGKGGFTSARPWRSSAAALLVVALVLCSAGTAGAAFVITGKRIKDESVTGRDIRDHSLAAKDVKGGVVRGAAGPAGPTGPPGKVAGPVGAAGPAGISGPLVQTATGTIDPSSTGDVSVACPAGTVAVGGGGFTPSDLGFIAQSAPTDPRGTGWTVSFHNRIFSPITATAEVVCVTAH
jgi:hypothetical protein